MTEIDTGMFKDWTLVKIEGEEPVKEEVIEVKASPVKGKAPPKPTTKEVVAQVIDNRPRIVSYKRDCAAESADLGVKFT